MMQPVVSDDVAATLADVAVAEPLNRTIDLAGPERIRMDVELVRRFLAASSDPRSVVTDVDAGYFGTPVDDQSLTRRRRPPGTNAFLRRSGWPTLDEVLAWPLGRGTAFALVYHELRKLAAVSVELADQFIGCLSVPEVAPPALRR